MEIIDKNMALDLLEQCVQERGEDYVYPTDEDGACSYVVDNQPSCIVGLALQKAGVNLGTIYGSIIGNNNAPLGARHDLRGFMTNDAYHVFREAQEEQDNEQTWGHALRVAKGLN